jgi:uncharacterized ferredoxin-like protein
MEDMLDIVAKLMVISARTAPKASGRDFIEIKVIKGEEVKRLASEMKIYGEKGGDAKFVRDGDNVAQSDAVVLVALNNPKTNGLNCGACGKEKCGQLQQGSGKGREFEGPWCAWRLIDLGIALASAAKTASILNADNRIMYRAGVAARRLKIIEGQLVVGIPISATGKNIYFDRQN